MRTFFQLPHRLERPLPDKFRDDDVRYPDALVGYFLQELTRPGDTVFDPFAGYGTTLRVAEAMDRIPAGLEYDPERVSYIRTQLRQRGAIVQGDARRLSSYDLPPFDMSITSPPYMQRDDSEDPLSAYTMPGRGYEAYLNDMRNIYAQVASLMKPNGWVVIEAANLKGPKGVTPLAWDIARAVGAVLSFEGEVVVGWDKYGYGYDHSYCLLFRHPASEVERPSV